MPGKASVKAAVLSGAAGLALESASGLAQAEPEPEPEPQP